MRIGKPEENVIKRINKHIKPCKNNSITAIKQAVIGFDFAAEAALICVLNELRAKKADYIRATVGLILPTDYTPQDATAIMEQLSGVSEREAVPIININVTTRQINKAIITVVANGELSEDKVSRKGSDIVIAGYVAGLGTAVMADLGKDELAKVFSKPFLRGASSFRENLSSGAIIGDAFKENAEYIFPFSEGGIFSGLWELAEKLKVGMSIDLKKIPIKQETIEFSEVFGINPYLLDSTGAVAIITDDGEKMENYLESLGIIASHVGTINNGNDRLLVNDGEVRYIDRPREDELYRFLSEMDKH